MLSDKDKIQNIYNKRNNRIFNTPLFPTLNVDINIENPFVNQTSNSLEGFDGNKKTKKKNIFAKDGNNSINKFFVNLHNKEKNIGKDVSNSTFISSTNDSVNNFQILASNTGTNVGTNINSIGTNIGSTFVNQARNPSNIIQELKTNYNKANKANSRNRQHPASFIDFLKGTQNFFVFFINFISNFFIYLSITIVQLSYRIVPIQPFGNINKSVTLPNWPWKLNLDVSDKDNLSKNPSAQLIDPSGGPIFVDGKYIPAAIYNENQQILYDSNIVFSVVIQILLVSIISFVFTNNVYYYVYKDSTSFPYRIIKPKNITKDGKIEIENDVSLIIYTLTNTLLCAPYDVLVGIIGIYKWFTQLNFIGLYTFPALNYIIIFLFVLYFNLNYFWNYYNYLINKPVIWEYHTFYAIFLIYGLLMHYFMVSKTSGTGKMYSSIYIFAGTILYRLFVFFLIVSILLMAYPLIRVLFCVWFLYIFFGLYGFTNDTYRDIINYKHTNKCEQNTFKLLIFIRNAINTFYKYFFYFVIFVLVFSVFNYLKFQKTFNPNSSSAMKILVSIIFLCVFMYLIYSFINKNTEKYENKVVYGKSFLQEKYNINTKLKETVNNMIISNIDIPLNKIKISGASKDNMSNQKQDVQNVSNSPDEEEEHKSNSPEEEEEEHKSNSPDEEEKVENQKVFSSIQNRLSSLNPIKNTNIVSDQISNILNTAPGFNNNISKFIKIFTEINNIFNKNLEDPFVKELLNKPINIDNLEKEFQIKLNASNIIDTKYLNKLKEFIHEIRKENIDINLLNFISKLGHNLFTENSMDIQTKLNKITKYFNEDIGIVKEKLGDVFKRVFPNEMNILIGITQIYNSGAQPLFIEIEPEIHILCLIISNIYTEETKSSILNILNSATSIGFSIIKMRM